LTSLAATDDPPCVGSEPRAGTASTRYEILGRLAEGGMAEIFLAKSIGMAGLERHVVLKRVLPERARDPAFVAMFLDEARLAAQLHHPNVAQVYDIGKLGDSFFFTMEYVHGENARELLAKLMTQRRQLAIGDALTIVAGGAAGLHHAHERRGPDRKPLGIVHRDVSPSNVLVSYEGSVKVVDFGIAKANARNAADTRTGSVKGKVAYMSPEQCKGRELDRRSDVFSLGIVLWELCTGHRLFKYDTDFDTMSAIVYQDVPPPSHMRPGVPAEVDKIAATAMAKDPNRRFATAAEMLEAIETAAVRTGHPLSTTALGRTIRTVFGDRPEPWIALREEPAVQQPITVTGEAFDIKVEDLGEVGARESARMAAVSGGAPAPEDLGPGPAAQVAAAAAAAGQGAAAVTLSTRPSVDELLRRTNPIPRGAQAHLQEIAAAGGASGVTTPDPRATLQLPPALNVPPQAASSGTGAGASLPGERIATRRGHVPAHRVAAAKRISSPPGGITDPSKAGSSSAAVLPGSKASGSTPALAEAPAGSLPGSSMPSATADIVRATRGRPWAAMLLIAVIVVGLVVGAIVLATR
jgi:serine/threonine protein kinase